jgi:hypothetical protein
MVWRMRNKAELAIMGCIEEMELEKKNGTTLSAPNSGNPLISTSERLKDLGKPITRLELSRRRLTIGAESLVIHAGMLTLSGFPTGSAFGGWVILDLRVG